ncbi:MAG: transcriptional regulator, TetR family, partial [Caulobacteraceae bacterium]|nr:transcriptional regulator, TetR family [Caulobacteraceae bacterium]
MSPVRDPKRRSPAAARGAPANASRQGPKTARAETTRERILEAALFLFAEFGLHGASLRDISARSQVPLSGLHYHFGSKEDLFAAAVEHVFRQLSAERLERLRELEMETGAPTLEAVLEAFIVPVLKLAASPTGIAYLRLQARMYDAREVSNDGLLLKVTEATAPFRRAIAQALPGAPSDDLIRGYRALVRDVLNTVSDPAY